MTNANYKTMAPPTLLEEFYNRANKKDSFERWYNRR